MQIYVGHASSLDYKTELYQPLRKLNLEGVEFLFPHEHTTEPTNSKENMKSIDLMIAEVSYPSTGLGIEMGWADVLGKPIVAIYMTGTIPSSAIQTICREVVEYTDPAELKLIVESLVAKYR